MKKFTTKMSVILCVLFFGISFNFSVTGQINKTFTPDKKGIFEKIHQKNKLANSNLKTEAIPQFYKSTNNTYPQEIHHYYWDVTTIWMADNNYFVTYDDHANILSKIIVIANTNDTVGRIINTYDNEERQVESLQQHWNNGSWENYYRTVRTYDDQGNGLVFLSQYWQSPTWVTDYGWKDNYTYDVNNNITELISQWWSSSINAWENYYKDIYTYDANGYLIQYIAQYWNTPTISWVTMYKEIYTIDAVGVIIEVLIQDWDDINLSWVNFGKVINIVWHNWTGDPDESDLESCTSLEWDSGIWVNFKRTNITYDAYGGYIEIEEQYINGNWENAYKESDLYDTHGNNYEYSEEYWINNNWMMQDGYKYLLTYSGIDLVERIFQWWNYITEQFENQWKEEYSDFVTIEGVDENVLIFASINLYPNPARGILNLEVKNMDKEDLSIEIVNLNGQVIFSKQFNNTGQLVNKIDVSNYSKGIYFVKVQNANELKVGKIIIQ
jgi:hypothetical protein